MSHHCSNEDCPNIISEYDFAYIDGDFLYCTTCKRGIKVKPKIKRTPVKSGRSVPRYDAKGDIITQMIMHESIGDNEYDVIYIWEKVYLKLNNSMQYQWRYVPMTKLDCTCIPLSDMVLTNQMKQELLKL